MCGIFGWVSCSAKPVDLARSKAALDLLAHRGPDDWGLSAWRDLRDDEPFVCGQESPSELNRGDRCIVLGSRRLAILDLTQAGHQPFISQDGRFAVVFNGEIYNYLELRSELLSLGHTFRSKCDTEVLLASYARWGEGCLRRFNGMFAFLILDREKGILFCARDRVGVKPLYYTVEAGQLVFASEIKAILHLPFVSRCLNERAAQAYFNRSLGDFSEETFFKGILQVPAGSALNVDLANGSLAMSRYWDVADASRAASFPNRQGYLDHYRALLEDAVRIRLRSDVALGSCLSGGLDSSAIVCIISQLLRSEHGGLTDVIGPRLSTFTATFDGFALDERRYAEAVNAVCAASAHFVTPTAESYWQDKERFIWHQEEPVGSSSPYAQWKVMQLASEAGVKVLLDGQGGDELLGGYTIYYLNFWAEMLRSRRLFLLVRELFALPLCGDPALLRGISYLRRFSLNRPRPPFYRLRHTDEPFMQPFRHRFNLSVTQRNIQDITTTMLPRLLHWEDRSSMAFSVESRLPFLDYRLVEAVVHWPSDLKFRGGRSKALTRDALASILPQLVSKRRQKIGFATPERQWIRSDLRDRYEEFVRGREFFAGPLVDRDKFLDELSRFRRGRSGVAFSEFTKVLDFEYWARVFNVSF